MKVFVVENRQGLLMGVFKTKSKATAFVRNIGGHRWEEKWQVVEVKLDQPEGWVLAGNDSYRTAKLRLASKKKVT